MVPEDVTVMFVSTAFEMTCFALVFESVAQGGRGRVGQQNHRGFLLAAFGRPLFHSSWSGGAFAKCSGPTASKWNHVDHV